MGVTQPTSSLQRYQMNAMLSMRSDSLSAASYRSRPGSGAFLRDTPHLRMEGGFFRVREQTSIQISDILPRTTCSDMESIVGALSSVLTEDKEPGMNCDPMTWVRFAAHR
jgi:hypothetical protein